MSQKIRVFQGLDDDFETGDDLKLARLVGLLERKPLPAQLQEEIQPAADAEQSEGHPTQSENATGSLPIDQEAHRPLRERNRWSGHRKA